MKKHTALTVALLAAGVAFAAPASAYSEPSLDRILQVDPAELVDGGSFFTTTGSVTLTYLGAYAGHTNFLSVGDTENIFQNNGEGHNHPGDRFTVTGLGAGSEITFKLFDSTTGSTWFSGAASNNADGKYHTKTWYNVDEGYALIGFEDLTDSQNSDWDYNDLVLRVENVAAVPEPETYAMLAAGLGAVAFARRRKAAK